MTRNARLTGRVATLATVAVAAGFLAVTPATAGRVVPVKSSSFGQASTRLVATSLPSVLRSTRGLINVGNCSQVGWTSAGSNSNLWAKICRTDATTAFVAVCGAAVIAGAAYAHLPPNVVTVLKGSGCALLAAAVSRLSGRWNGFWFAFYPSKQPFSKGWVQYGTW